MKGLRDFADPMCESLRSRSSRAAANDGDWDAGVAAIAADQPAVLLLPRTGASRTLTHGDALHLIANARSLLPLRAGDERLALLPMCHVMERVLGLYLSLDARVISNYLENPDTAIENLQEVQPTVLATDPQVWQRAARSHQQRRRRRHAAAAHAVSLGDRRGCARRAGRRCWRVSACCARSCANSACSRLRRRLYRRRRLPPEIERWAAALGITIQPIDGQATRGAALDARYQALMREAYGT